MVVSLNISTESLDPSSLTVPTCAPREEIVRPSNRNLVIHTPDCTRDRNNVTFQLSALSSTRDESCSDRKLCGGFDILWF